MNRDTQTMATLLTYEDYCLIPDDGRRHEIIHGGHYVSPSPQSIHQRILGNLYYLFRQYLKDTPVGTVMLSPLDVVLSNHNIVQPDLLYISNEQTAILEEKNVQGAPDLVIEILSEGNRRHDEVRKRNLYEEFGISEYWIVDPVLETIKVYLLSQEKYERVAEISLEAGDSLSTPLLPGFSSSLEEVFGQFYTGSVRINVAPSPSSLSTDNEPPCPCVTIS